MGTTHDAQEVIDLTMSRRRPGLIEVYAGPSPRRVIGTLTAASISALGLRGGEPCTPQVLEAIENRVALERAYKAAADLLARKPLTTQNLKERLERRGFDSLVVEEALRVLAKDGLVDDAGVAREIVRSTLSRGGAGDALLESKLVARGVDPETARQAIDSQRAAHPSTDAAYATALRRVASFPPGLSIDAQARRLYAYLARRGFEEHEAAQTVERVLQISSAE